MFIYAVPLAVRHRVHNNPYNLITAKQAAAKTTFPALSVIRALQMSISIRRVSVTEETTCTF